MVDKTTTTTTTKLPFLGSHCLLKWEKARVFLLVLRFETKVCDARLEARGTAADQESTFPRQKLEIKVVGFFVLYQILNGLSHLYAQRSQNIIIIISQTRIQEKISFPS